MKYLTALCLLPALALCSVSIFAKEAPPEVEPLTLMDQGYLDRHRAFVDELGRSEFGTRVRKNKGDLQLIKRILEAKLINQTEKSKFHSLGVVLGDIYVSELNMEWRNYTDDYGKSHAVCVPDTSHCLFPVTMISKRGVLGVTPDAVKIYNRGVELIADELPKIPYSVKKPENTSRDIKTHRLKTQ